MRYDTLRKAFADTLISHTKTEKTRQKTAEKQVNKAKKQGFWRGFKTGVIIETILIALYLAKNR